MGHLFGFAAQARRQIGYNCSEVDDVSGSKAKASAGSLLHHDKNIKTARELRNRHDRNH
jgi:hypothetical protein